MATALSESRDMDWTFLRTAARLALADLDSRRRLERLKNRNAPPLRILRKPLDLCNSSHSCLRGGRVTAIQSGRCGDCRSGGTSANESYRPVLDFDPSIARNFFFAWESPRTVSARSAGPSGLNAFLRAYTLNSSNRNSGGSLRFLAKPFGDFDLLYALAGETPEQTFAFSVEACSSSP